VKRHLRFFIDAHGLHNGCNRISLAPRAQPDPEHRPNTMLQINPVRKCLRLLRCYLGILLGSVWPD